MHLFLIFTTQMLWALSLMGLGSVLPKILYGNKSISSLDPHQSLMIHGMLGFVLVTAAGTVLNFVIPLTAIVSSFVLGAGMLLFLLNEREYITSLSRSDYLTLFSLLALTWGMSLLGVTEGDTTVYHLQTVRWVKESVLPFGLANLHGRLGYNSLWFVAAAVMELPFGPKSPFLTNAIMMFFYGGFAVLTLKRKYSHAFSRSETFLTLSLIPWGWTACLNTVSSLSNDLPVMLITFLVFYLILLQFENGHKDTFILIVILLLSFFAVTIKLSAAILPLASLTYLAWFLQKRRKRSDEDIALQSKSFSKPSSWMVFSILAVLLSSWVLRGIFLSGCIAFPLDIGCFSSLKWAVPLRYVRYETDFIRAYARISDLLTPGTTNRVFADWGWLGEWMRRWFLSNYIVHILPLLALFLTGLYWLPATLFQNRISWNEEGWAFAFVFCFSLAGTFFWFFSAPDFRFGFGYLYSFCIMMNGYPLSQRSYGREEIGKRNFRYIALAGLILIAFLLNISKFLLNNKAFAHIPEPDMSRIAVIDRVSVIYPEKTDCSDAPLPCSTFLDKGLRIEAGENGKPRMFWFEKNREEK